MDTWYLIFESKPNQKIKNKFLLRFAKISMLFSRKWTSWKWKQFVTKRKKTRHTFEDAFPIKKKNLKTPVRIEIFLDFIFVLILTHSYNIKRCSNFSHCKTRSSATRRNFDFNFYDNSDTKNLLFSHETSHTSSAFATFAKFFQLKNESIKSVH